jgi:hypothetical protein
MPTLKRSSLAIVATALVALFVPAPQAQAPHTTDAFPPVLDPQHWQDQDTMTWDDYRPIPGINWADPSPA